MTKPVLVLLAAGMGSRYGGLKQIDPIDDAGNLIIDFSIYDALRAGFEDLVFIIKKEIEADFNEAIASRISKYANVTCAYQELYKLPEGFSVPAGRKKPLGTTHALLCAKDEIAGRPFAVINSDDYYGPEAFKLLYDFLSDNKEDSEQLMVSYLLENTLTDYGSVARGVCSVDDSGYLSHITERRRIIKDGDGGAFTEDGVTFTHINVGTPVSMNCWGFKNGILDELYKVFRRNLEEKMPSDPEKYEDLLPNAIQDIMAAGKIKVRVERSHDRWFGVTYKEDKPAVTEAIAKLKEKGVYADKLWR